MAEKVSVCHVVNSVSDASIPGELATTQTLMEEFEHVGMLVWFDVEPFRHMERVDTVSLNMPNKFSIDRSQYRQIKSILSEYDIIHTHHPHSGFYAKLIAKRIGTPVFQTEHNDHSGYTRWGRIANGLTNLLADGIGCVSESVRESFTAWEGVALRDGKISIIYNGIDIDRLSSAKESTWSIQDVVDVDDNATVVGSAGMLTEQKGHDRLIEAIDRANAESEQPIELVISGDGNGRERLESQIEHAEYSDRLHLLGFLEEREQVYKMMEEIDIYVMASRWEGFCVAVLEAMALGNPCVLSDISVFREVYGDAALFYEADNPRSLIDKILHLIEQPSKYEMYEKRSKNLSKLYDIEDTATEYTAAYKSIVD